MLNDLKNTNWTTDTTLAVAQLLDFDFFYFDISRTYLWPVVLEF